MKKTKDEIFLLKLFEVALEQGNPWEQVDKYTVGRAIGQNDRGIDIIVRDLAQANFIKKGEANCIYLTQNGLNLIELLKEKS